MPDGSSEEPDGGAVMRKAFLAALLTIAFIAPGLAAGTLPGISMSQQFDSLGKPLNGGRLYLIQAGTTNTPQNCYQDSGLTIAWPNPITLDAAGRVPQLFCADGVIKIRLTNTAGVQQLVQDNLLVVGPSGGGGGGSAVDSTTVAATGDLKARYETGVISGWVRANGRTIGSSTSGATERANADCQALFAHLWNIDTNLSVSGGRGVSAAADWSANKTIELPDWAGRAIAGLDDMGAGAKGRLTSTYFGTAANVLGAVGGSESHVLTTAELAAHYHEAFISDAGHRHAYNASNNNLSNQTGGGSLSLPIGTNNTVTEPETTGVRVTGNNGLDKTSTQGSGNAHAIVQPTKLATI